MVEVENYASKGVAGAGLGLGIAGTALGLLQNGDTVRDYYYHSVSHQLGLDCHDITCPACAVLKPGMVITVEPGLYVEQENIGIRIENDIQITEGKAIDLSKGILITVEDIEALMTK